MSTRIHRGPEAYITRKLGALGADLGVLAGLFEERWRRPVASLTGVAQGFVLNQAGFRLRELGRLHEAVELMLSGLEPDVARCDWRGAAISAGNVSELRLTLGRISEAIAAAKRSVDFAERTGDAFQRMSKRTTLADALHQAGRIPEAQTLFQEAERMQADSQPEYPLLYSLPGYRYCDLLLAQGNYQGVIDRATRTLEWSRLGGGSLLTNAVNHLSLGRAHLLVARAESTDAYKAAWVHIDQAVDGLRQVGTMDHLPRGLLAQAELYLFTADHADARAALNEAMDIATRDPAGHMKLFVTDCHLGYARLALAEKKPDVAQRELAEVRALTEETGYRRRVSEHHLLEELL